MTDQEELRIEFHPGMNTLVREDGAFWVKGPYGHENLGKWSFGHTYKSSRGYVRFHNYSVHRAIAECFIPNPENKPTVDHIDRNRSNNSVSNLRWATHSEQRLNSSQSIGHNTKETKLKAARERRKKFVRYWDETGKRKEILREQVTLKKVNGVWKYVLKE